MILSKNDLHALRGLVRAHLKRKTRKLRKPDYFAPKPGQAQEDADRARAEFERTVAFYEGLHDRVRAAEEATDG